MRDYSLSVVPTGIWKDGRLRSQQTTERGNTRSANTEVVVFIYLLQIRHLVGIHYKQIEEMFRAIMADCTGYTRIYYIVVAQHIKPELLLQSLCT